jgi:hypothetical protein
MTRLFYIICLFSLMVLKPFTLYSENWEVPEDKKTVLSPIKFNDSTRQEGAKLFVKYCISCHGEPGKNNFIRLEPQPGDPASSKFSSQTDGSLFYKITNGRSLMPKFGALLKEKERWEIISYIRSFHQGYIQPELPVAARVSDKTIDLTLVKVNDSTLETRVYKVVDSLRIPEFGVELVLKVKRYFGQLQVDEPKTTNKEGKVIFRIDSKLPADTTGNNIFIVSPSNKDVYGDAEYTNTFSIGVKNTIPPMNEKRTIWNVVQKAPWWILLTYTLGVISVLFVLGYIVFQLSILRKKL